MTFLVKKNYPEEYITNILIPVYLSTSKPIQVMNYGERLSRCSAYVSKGKKNTHRNIESHEKLRLDNYMTARELDDRND